jgi:hypothetical protein
MDLAVWLRSLGLEQYEAALRVFLAILKIALGARTVRITSTVFLAGGRSAHTN